MAQLVVLVTLISSVLCVLQSCYTLSIIARTFVKSLKTPHRAIEHACLYLTEYFLFSGIAQACWGILSLNLIFHRYFITCSTFEYVLAASSSLEFFYLLNFLFYKIHLQLPSSERWFHFVRLFILGFLLCIVPLKFSCLSSTPAVSFQSIEGLWSSSFFSPFFKNVIFSNFLILELYTLGLLLFYTQNLNRLKHNGLKKLEMFSLTLMFLTLFLILQGSPLDSSYQNLISLALPFLQVGFTWSLSRSVKEVKVW